MVDQQENKLHIDIFMKKLGERLCLLHGSNLVECISIVRLAHLQGRKCSQKHHMQGLEDSDDDLGVDNVDAAEDAQGEAIVSHNDMEEQNVVEESKEEKENLEKVLDDSLKDARYMTDT